MIKEYKTRNDFDSEPDYVRYLHREETKYIEKFEENVLAGKKHPFIDYWYEQSRAEDEIPEKPETFKQRYSICKACDKFLNTTKQCKQCWCFMPLKAQFKRFSCPEGKW